MISSIAFGCEPDCTNNGRCIDGVCVCPSGFDGPACEYGKTGESSLKLNKNEENYRPIGQINWGINV